MEAQPQTTKNTISTDTTETNIPKAKIENQPRPKVDMEKLAACKLDKDCKIKNNQIVKK